MASPCGSPSFARDPTTNRGSRRRSLPRVPETERCEGHDLRWRRVRSDVADLIDELLTLGVSDPLFILLGQKTGRAFRDHEGVLAPALGLARLRSVEVPHYSAANGAKHRNQPQVYRAIVQAALAAPEPR
jgi:hypothetical protein